VLAGEKERVKKTRSQYPQSLLRQFILCLQSIEKISSKYPFLCHKDGYGLTLIYF
jgi:hypothetical protein